MKDPISLVVTIDNWQNHIDLIQKYLNNFGYLGDYLESKFDRRTEDALKAFQKDTGLSQTGMINESTLNMMRKVKYCQRYSELNNNSSNVGRFTLIPTSSGGFSKHSKSVLTYKFVNVTSDVSTSVAKTAVRNALNSWSRHIPLTFSEVTSGISDLEFSWEQGDHGDGAPFDDGGDSSGNTLAHAFFPPPEGGIHAGKCHFDEFEDWNTNFDIETIALHEIGHLLGLAHSSVGSATMAPFYNGRDVTLSTDDIRGVQFLYGINSRLRVLVHMRDIGDRTFNENDIAGTRGQSRRLEGFQIVFDPPLEDGASAINYTGHVRDVGDLRNFSTGEFCGTRGRSLRLEGASIWLSGPISQSYDVEYRTHVQDVGDLPFVRNGQFSGTKGRSLRVEMLQVRLVRKPGI